MNNIVDVIESTHQKLSTLNFDIYDLSEIFVVLGFARPYFRFYERTWDERDQNLGLVEYISNLWEISRSEVRRLIKGNGLKINNQTVPENILIKDLPWIQISEEWRVCVIKKGKNEFDFILW